MAQIVKKEDLQEPKERKYTFFLPYPDVEVQKMLIHRGHRISMDFDKDWDIALFTGGADICPFLYGEPLHNKTAFNLLRDMREVKKFKQMHHKRMKVGICRGAQLLNLMSGGRMWQHVDGHSLTKGHPCKFYYDNDQVIEVSSRHHQLMIPGSEAWIMAEAKQARTFINYTDGEMQLTDEQRERTGWSDCEVAYYGSTNSLCFQPHPEDTEGPCRDEFFLLLDTFWNEDQHAESLKAWD